MSDGFMSNTSAPIDAQYAINPSHPLLQPLNEQQRQAVVINDRPLLILAGAGAGKTKTIVHKIAYLIQEEGVAPYNILGLTFTKKAAQEMKQRVANMLQTTPADLGLFMGTFHSFGALLLRRYGEYVGLNKNFTIYDVPDQVNLIKAIIKDGVIDSIVKPAAIHKKIVQAKLQGIEPGNYFEHSYQDHFDEIVTKAYFEYQKRLTSLNAVDFTDLLTLTLKLLDKNESIRVKLATKYRYILVDEYQDTNILQYRIVYNLAKDHRKLTVVGDEDQSIYSWRGATVENINLFKKDFPEHALVKLERNYRSTKIILTAANKIIEKNPNRIGKTLWTDRSEQIPIKIVELATPTHQAKYVAKKIMDIYAKTDVQDKPPSVAILYRINAQSRILEEQLIKFGIPYRIVGNVGFYERMEIKDILAYVKFLTNPRDEISLLRIINVPARRIGPKAIETLKKAAADAMLEFAPFIYFMSAAKASNVWSNFISPNMHARLLSIYESHNLDNYKQLFDVFGTLIQRAHGSTYTVPEFLKFLIQTIEYDKWLVKVSSTEEEYQNRQENILELMRIVDKQISPMNQNLKAPEAQSQQPETDAQDLDIQGDVASDNSSNNSNNTMQKTSNIAHLVKFLEDIALIESVKEQTQEHGDDAEVVNLMTVHAAKGLEFDVVFIVGANDDLFPHARSKDDPIRIQEERRLFYVAVTRAKTHLYITYTQTMFYGPELIDAQPSPYISDIPWDIVEFEEG